MQTEHHPANSRGHASHGWLDSFHTFSFARYFNPGRMQFGALRVLNDDTVLAGMGFGTHPHHDMEIVSIPLEGALEHQDSMGNKTVIREGEVQVMSAGTGIHHSEMNHSKTAAVRFLQIWILPEKTGQPPRYDQQFFDKAERKNQFQTVVSPISTTDAGVKLNQESWFSLIDMDHDTEKEYRFRKEGNGLYVFVLEGQLAIDKQVLHSRDGLAITETDVVTLKSNSDSRVLLIEIPMIF